jgi:hypothetical protein
MSADISPVVSNILKRKSNVSDFIDMSRHFTEPISNPDGSTSMTISKRNKVTSTQAVAIVSKQKMTSTNIFHPDRTEQVTDIVSTAKNQDMATVSKDKSLSKTKRKQLFNGDVHIQDANYKEMIDDVIESQKRFKTVEPRDARNLRLAKNSRSLEKRRPSTDTISEEFLKFTGEETRPKFSKDPARDARNLGLAERSKSPEPSAIAAISESRRTKSGLTRVKPSKKVQNVDTNWLIDEAFDQLVDTGKAIGKVGKTAEKVAGKAVKQGFKGVKTGIRAIGELAEEFEKTPMAKNLNRNADVEFAHLRSHAKRARESIAGTANIANKRTRTAASLITQHTIGTKTTTAATFGVGATNQYGFFGIYEYGKSGKLELHYYHKDKSHRLTHDQVRRILTPKQIHLLKQEAVLGHNAASTTTVQANLGDNTGTIAKKPVKRKLNQPRVATTSGLVRRHRARVV